MNKNNLINKINTIKIILSKLIFKFKKKFKKLFNENQNWAINLFFI